MRAECRARLILERVLHRKVELNDDGQEPGLYDLRVGDPTAPEIAIECTGAVDPVRTEAWNIGPARGPLSCDLKGNWTVTLRPKARVRSIRTRIEALLKECERAQLLDFLPVDFRLKRRHPSLFASFQSLEVRSIHCYQEDGEGRVTLGMTGVGGAVDEFGRAVPGWIGQFLRAPERGDVLSKLLGSGASECHVFIPVSFGGAPWPVMSYLCRDIKALPPSAPDLPAPVNAVWLTCGVNGVWWDGKTWSSFDATVPSDAL